MKEFPENEDHKVHKEYQLKVVLVLQCHLLLDLDHSLLVPLQAPVHRSHQDLDHYLLVLVLDLKMTMEETRNH